MITELRGSSENVRVDGRRGFNYVPRATTIGTFVKKEDGTPKKFTI